MRRENPRVEPVPPVSSRARRYPRARRCILAAAIIVTGTLAACVPASGPYVSLAPCGGDLPPCYVKQRESGGDYRAVSPDGLYRGAWQFAYGTWNGYGGYALADQAPPWMQDDRAREVWAGGAGCSNWNAC